MNISRRLMLIGVMLIVLSMTMATQYVTTKIGYSYNIVHPCESDIRFIGSDNSSDGIRILRMTGVNTTSSLELALGGNISANQNKTYTCAFGIVNEEKYAVNITHINVSITGSGASADYMQIWLHGNRTEQKESDGSAVKVWDNGSLYHNASTAWVLAAGDGLPDTMCDNHTAGHQLDTPWDTSALVRVSTNTNNDSESGVSDFVWVQISLNIPATVDINDTFTGTIFIFTRAGT